MEKLVVKHLKYFLIALLVTIPLFFLFKKQVQETDNDWYGGLMLLCGIISIVLVKEIVYFLYNFGLRSRHLINWKYPNGDQVIITCWGLLKHEREKPELVAKHKFEGFSWGLDNAKDLIETLLKNEGNPLLTLLPEINFSTTTNQIGDYISFGASDKINLTLIDFDPGYVIIHIDQKTDVGKSTYQLSYPMPPINRTFAAEVEKFEKRWVGRRSPINAVYLDKASIQEIMDAETETQPVDSTVQPVAPSA